MDILLIVFSSSVLYTVRHSRKSCFFLFRPQKPCVKWFTYVTIFGGVKTELKLLNDICHSADEEYLVPILDFICLSHIINGDGVISFR